VTNVVIHCDRPEDFLDLLAARFPDIAFTCCRSYDELPTVLASARPEVVYGIRFAGTPGFPRHAILSSPGLKWFSVGGSGTDHLAPWDPAALTVTNAAGVAADMMAQYALGAVLSLTLGFPAFERDRQARRWTPGRVAGIDGKTVAVVGLGHTGRAVERRFKTMGLTVVGVRANPRPTDNVDRVFGAGELHEALGAADYVVVCVPLIHATRGFIDAPAIAAMAPGTILVDVSRGGVVVGDALLDALRSGHLAGAALDVFEAEPLPPESPFWALDNVIVTPHCASEYPGWERRSAEMFSDNLERFRRGEPLDNVVDPIRGY
jgi:phosphoglycerate dehydrogenase-like enzyme